jgi:serine/threonine protein kinase
MSDLEVEEAMKESNILQSLDHPFIIKFLKSFKSKDGHLNILMSYADGGDLNQSIK